MKGQLFHALYKTPYHVLHVLFNDQSKESFCQNQRMWNGDRV